MEAIILAGGAGTRLREVISDIPKPMAPIAGKPFLEYLILFLKKNNVKKIVLSIGYKKEVIQKYFQDGSRLGIDIIYCEENYPLGTGGATKKSLKYIDAKECLVLNGDSFIDMEIKALKIFHKSTKALVTLSLISVDNTSRYGRVEINDTGKVVKFAEKGVEKSGFINGGISIINKDVFKNNHIKKLSWEEDILPKMIADKLFGLPITTNLFIDIGLPQSYKMLCKNPAQLIKAIN